MLFSNRQKLFQCVNIFSKLQRRNIALQNTFSVESLDRRTLLKLSGSETNSYLQSMMTNDVRNLEHLPTLYSLLLNSRGRVLYDILLYKLNDNDYLVEYDSTAVEHIEKHLIMYRLRKDVKIKLSTDFKSWVIYKATECLTEDESNFIIRHLIKMDGIVTAVKDPRIKELGIRVIANKSVELPKLLPSNFHFKQESYRLFRYKIGVGEGVLDHPPGQCTPFDINVDLLNGVNFTKGCYIGQEMTAKSQHVFTIRKRLMPILLQRMNIYPVFPPECAIVNENGLKLGRLRSHFGEHGLAFLKYEDCERSEVVKLKGFDVTLKAFKPKWWPDNLKKEHSLVV